jgi:hypothetical protein
MEGCTKDGIVNEKQRYKCKSCGYRHTVKHLGKSPDIKCQALQLYLEGPGFRSIGWFLNCSHVAVYNWIKAHGESIEPLRSDKDIEVVELDEMHTYIGSKKLLLDLDCCRSKWKTFPPLRSGFPRYDNRAEVMESYQGQKHKRCHE